MTHSTGPPPSIDSSTRYPSLTFTTPHLPTFGPRVGHLSLTRDRADTDGEVRVTMDTPNVLVCTSRGVVPHLSRDHLLGSEAIQWVNVVFESFLEQTPPVPALENGPHPLHTFLGFDTTRHIASLCLRNPLDAREMPPNGNTYVSANCVRGVKKVTLSDWRKYVYKMQPDIVFALTDTPFTPPPYSQKRITKSIERSAAWLADILQPLSSAASPPEPQPDAASLSRHPLNVFVHMAGGTSVPAREAFAYGITETLHGPEATTVRPLRCLDEGISGYAFDLAVLRDIKPRPNTSQHQSLPDDFLQLDNPETIHPGSAVEVLDPSTAGAASTSNDSAAGAEPSDPPSIAVLLKASLGELPVRKPRLVTGTRSPHEMLRLIRDVGVDIFDVGWAMSAANVGVALDFCFPVPVGKGVDGYGRRWLGHNLYDEAYARQYGRLADMFEGAGEGVDDTAVERRICPCIACSPRSPTSHILHSVVDYRSYATLNVGGATVRYEKPYCRAYIHHLLRTHEMSAHTFLVAHNVAVVSAFLAGVRQVCVEDGDQGESTRFAIEVERFKDVYDESGDLFVAARKDWESVDKARGKGRLARERDRQEDDQDG